MSINRKPIAVLLPIIIVNLINIFFVIKKKNLHKPGYYLLINLSVSDILRVITACIHENAANLNILTHISYYSSIITTILISVDRYISIRHCLRYRQIVTRKRCVYSIIVSWCISIFLKLLPMIESARLRKNKRYKRTSDDVIRYVVTIGSSIVLVSLSLYTLYIRRKQVQAIRKIHSNFGVEQEKLDILERLKRSLKDLFRLNIVTAFVIATTSISQICYQYTTSVDTYFKFLQGILALAYLIMNPFLYALTLSELRRHYYGVLKYIISHISCICHVNRIHEANIDAIQEGL